MLQLTDHVTRAEGQVVSESSESIEVVYKDAGAMARLWDQVQHRGAVYTCTIENKAVQKCLFQAGDLKPGRKFN